LVFLAALASAQVRAQSAGAKVFADKAGRVRILLEDGHRYSIPGEPGQADIESVQTFTEGKMVRWLVDYANEGEPTLEAGKLIIFRRNRVIQRFDTDQLFLRWHFYAGGTKVTYCTGPTHGANYVCQLRDIGSGRVLTKWFHKNGEPEDDSRPDWVTALDQ
jgi:hypothetical protein